MRIRQRDGSACAPHLQWHEAAAHWSSQYAFAPEGVAPSKDAEHASLQCSETFVRFYWALYTGKERDALDVVNRERTKRGFGYRLSLPPRWGPGRGQRGRNTRPSQGVEDVSLGHTSQMAVSRGARGRRAPRKPGTAEERDAEDGPVRSAAELNTRVFAPTFDSSSNPLQAAQTLGRCPARPHS